MCFCYRRCCDVPAGQRTTTLRPSACCGTSRSLWGFFRATVGSASCSPFPIRRFNSTHACSHHPPYPSLPSTTGAAAATAHEVEASASPRKEGTYLGYSGHVSDPTWACASEKAPHTLSSIQFETAGHDLSFFLFFSSLSMHSLFFSFSVTLRPYRP